MSNEELKQLLQKQIDKLEKIKVEEFLIEKGEDYYMNKERYIRIHIDTCRTIEKHLGKREAEICHQTSNKIGFNSQVLSLKSYLKVLIENL